MKQKQRGRSIRTILCMMVVMLLMACTVVMKEETISSVAAGKSFTYDGKNLSKFKGEKTFVLQKNVFRQLPLYRFLEGQAVEDRQRQDQETYEKLVESNTRYLGKMVREENKDARVTPEITEKPQIMDSAENEERSEVTETPKPEKDNAQTVRTESPAEED